MMRASSFSLPRGAVFKPRFITVSGDISVGSAFAVFVPEVGAGVLVTCQHLFGPAGGLVSEIAAQGMDRFVGAVRLFDRWDGTPIGDAGRAVVLPEADGASPVADLAAFVLLPQPKVSVLRFAEDMVEQDETVYVACRVRTGPRATKALHRASMMGDIDNDGSEWIWFRDKDLDVADICGAPVFDGKGSVIGMVVALQGKSGLSAQVLPAKQMRALIGRVIKAPAR